MPELYSQVLDLREKDVFLETEINDTLYFSVTGLPSTLSYGKHPFSITFNKSILSIFRLRWVMKSNIKRISAEEPLPL